MTLKPPLGVNFPDTYRTRAEVLFESPVNVQYPEYGAVGDGVTDDTVAINAAITAANASHVPVYFPGTTSHYLVSATLTTLTTSPGIIGEVGKSQVKGSFDGDIFKLKGSLKKIHGLYVVNNYATHSAEHAAIRVQNCAYGSFEDVFTQTCGSNAVGFLLEHVYDGSAADAEFIAHSGCWYNTFRNLTCIYGTTSTNAGYGLSFKTDATAIGVVDPPGQTAGTYEGSVSYNEVTGFNIENKARGINLDRADNNTFIGGQFIAGVDQVYGRNASSANSFIATKFNQWTTSPFNLDSSCASTSIIAPYLFTTTSAPWSLGTTGSRPIIIASDEAITEHGLTLNDVRIARDTSNSIRVVPASGTVYNLNRPDGTASAIRLGNGTHSVFGNTKFQDATGAADALEVIGDGYIRFTEIGTPGAAPANSGYFFAKDNGSGKTQLCVLFASGATQVVATEP